MINNNALDDIFSKDGVIKQHKSSYTPRPSQITAAHHLLENLVKKNNMILEGPCGFGKTFAYLIPIFEYIYMKRQGRIVDIEDTNSKEHIMLPQENIKAVIATNGISLQEQLAYMDAPFVSDLFKATYPDATPIKIALFKGKQNFLCKRKLETLWSSILDNIEDNHLNEFQEFVTETHTGDLSELTFIPNNTALGLCCCVGSDECQGNACKCYNECYYQKHKKKALASDIIICNYHILFTATKVPLLPSFNILVMDEAHEAAAVMRSTMQQSFSLNSIDRLNKDLTSFFSNHSVSLLLEQLPESRIDSLFQAKVNDLYKPHSTLINHLMSVATLYFQDTAKACNINVMSGFNQTYVCENTFSHIPHENLITAIKNIQGVAIYFYDMIDNVVEDNSGEDEESSDLISMRSKIEMISVRMSEWIHLISAQRESDEEEFNDVYYAEKIVQKDRVRFSINRQPVKMAKYFQEAFWDNEAITSSILTSATLSVNESFDYIEDQLGLFDSSAKHLEEYIGQSPFNLTKQELWYLPTYACDGNKAGFEEYFTKLTDDITKSVKGGILFLTTSNKLMNVCYNQVLNTLQMNNINVSVYKQGFAPKVKLIEQFKNDKDSILVATKSFFTGIDVPGDSLRCLVIDKFPFASPDDPVMKRLSAVTGGFFKYSIPNMIITLKQAVGRGVRSINDKCVILIADGRMATARYKAVVHKSFTYDKTATRNMDDVIKFLNE